MASLPVSLTGLAAGAVAGRHISTPVRDARQRSARPEDVSRLPSSRLILPLAAPARNPVAAVALDKSEAAQRLARHGLDPSVPREAVVSLLLQSPERHHPAESLCAAMLDSSHRCAISSFRRAIYELFAAGVLSRVTVSPGGNQRMHFYELADYDHHHLFCVRCHRLEEVIDAEIIALEQHVLQSRHLTPALVIRDAMHGICAICQ